MLLKKKYIGTEETGNMMIILTLITLGANRSDFCVHGQWWKCVLIHSLLHSQCILSSLGNHGPLGAPVLMLGVQAHQCCCGPDFLWSRWILARAWSGTQDCLWVSCLVLWLLTSYWAKANVIVNWHHVITRWQCLRVFNRMPCKLRTFYHSEYGNALGFISPVKQEWTGMVRIQKSDGGMLVLVQYALARIRPTWIYSMQSNSCIGTSLQVWTSYMGVGITSAEYFVSSYSVIGILASKGAVSGHTLGSCICSKAHPSSFGSSVWCKHI